MSISQNYPNTSPAMLIDLANTQKLDPRVAFSRASTGTFYDANGLLRTADANEARFQFDPVTGVSEGLLRENQATNLVTHSESQSLNWAVQGAGTFSASSSVAPDGQTGNVTRVQGTVLNDGASKAFTAPSSGQYFGTTFVRSRTGLAQQCKIAFSGSTGATINIPATGWTRIGSLSGALGAGARFVSIRSVGDPIDLDVYGVQTELNFFPTSYIKTVASQVTRAADTARLTNVDAYNTAEFTAVSKPFGVSGVSATQTVLNGDVPVERLYVYPRNLPQDQINTLVENEGWWSWRIVGADFALPNFTTDGTVIVDWGDGTVGTLTTAVHTFTNASPHTVRFRMGSGTFFGPTIFSNATHANKVIAVGSVPSNMLVDCNRMFAACSNLKSIDATLTGQTSFLQICFGCTSLVSFPFVDSSNATNFQQGWGGCTSLSSFPLIDSSSVTNFFNAWTSCPFTSFPLIDTSSGTSFSGAWNGCSSLTSFPKIDTSSGTIFTSAWLSCSSLTSFPLIDTGAGTAFNRTWEGCTSLTSFPAINTSSGTNFSDTWNNCNKLTSFPLLDMSLATDLNECWDTCTSLTEFPAIDFPVCTNFAETWRGCSSLTSFPLIDTSAGTTFAGTWEACTSLTSFPLLVTSSVTNFASAWRSCSSLTSFPLIDISSGTTFASAWRSCTSLTDFPANMFDSWTGVPVANCFFFAWDSCTSLTPTSVVNILTSIDTSGQSAPASGVDIRIGYAGGDITAASTAITNLKSRGWTVTINGVLQ